MRVESPAARRGHAASVGFIRKIFQAVRAAVSARRWDLYRPEIHYMRGPGPRSRKRDASSKTA